MSPLPRLALALAAALLAAGCGARPDLEDLNGADVPRVPDCARRTPDAVPLASLTSAGPDLGSDPFHLTTDGAHLYFISEGRVFRVAKASGAPQALTPPGTGSGGVVVQGGDVYWSAQGSVFRVPLAGGAPETVGAAPGYWAIDDGALLTAGPAGMPAPLIRTPSGGGPSQVLLPSDGLSSIDKMVPDGTGVLVLLSRSLVLVPAAGAPVVLYPSPPRGEDLILDDGFAYFNGASGSTPADTEYRVKTDGASTPEALIDGFTVSAAIVGDTLYANLVLPDSTGSGGGHLVNLPKAGGAYTLMTTTDARHLPPPSGQPPNDTGPLELKTAGLVADAARVYFFEQCTDLSPVEFRLVSLPVDYVASP